MNQICWPTSISGGHEQWGCPLSSERSGKGVPFEDPVKSPKSWENQMSKLLHLRMARGPKRSSVFLSMFVVMLLHPVLVPRAWTRLFERTSYQQISWKYSWIISMIKSVTQFWLWNSEDMMCHFQNLRMILHRTEIVEKVKVRDRGPNRSSPYP